MASQIACLKCGESRVREQTFHVDRKSEKQVSVMRNLVGGGLLVLFGGLLLLLAIVGGYDAMVNPTGDRTDLYFMLFWGAIALPMLILGVELVVRYFRADKTKLFRYTCPCGHQWERWEDGWDSVACPKCGKSMVTSRTFPLDPQKPQSRKRPGRAGNLFVGSVSLAAGIGLIAFAARLWFTAPLLLGLFVKLFVSAVGLSALGWGGQLVGRYFRRNWVKLFMYECAACGFRWERQENEEYKAAAPDAELIDQG